MSEGSLRCRNSTRNRWTGWLGRQDSNLGSRDQNPLPYRLATPQSYRSRPAPTERTCLRIADMPVVLPSNYERHAHLQRAGSSFGAAPIIGFISSSQRRDSYFKGVLAGPASPRYKTARQGHRSVAQPGSAPASGAGGRRFKSCHSDHFQDHSDNSTGDGLVEPDYSYRRRHSRKSMSSSGSYRLHSRTAHER